ncbi:hypothetical protein AWZ03_009922 [Drosophila navojoa]|uniref:Kazal-like domain-containing protein n=1 Tax=Drosophila navojoa TaxID=7232 RepID=A0A484B4V2_DRONA|nr:uncharacterized protein LOC108655586 [Drosophila navojoa]TDG43679.1 hypothetical protein AWZ03_009922 [Drosophila navojoa]
MPPSRRLAAQFHWMTVHSMMLPTTAWLLMALMALRAGRLLADEQLAAELAYYATAGSEDIYLQANSGQWEEYKDYPDDKANERAEEEDDSVEDSAEEQPEGDNIEAVGLDENSCEYSCPRYYRPVCVKRNEQLITYATPCEYLNQLRCANVVRSQGKEAPTYQLLYQHACKENRH